MAKPEDIKELCCSFCGKKESEVEMLLSGPGVYICNECVKQCEQIMAKKSTRQPEIYRNLRK